MRIAYVVHNYPPGGVAGTEVYTWSLAQAMARLGHEVWVFVPGAHPGRREDGPVHVWATARPQAGLLPASVATFWYSFRHPALERDWRKFLRMVRPELVHFQHLQNVSARLPGLTKVPVMATLHDYWYLCANGQLLLPDHTICPGGVPASSCALCGLAKAGLPPSRLLANVASLPFVWRNRAVSQALRQMDHIISPSAFLLQRYVEQGLPTHKISVLENGLDPSRMAAQQDVACGRLPGLHLMFLGSIAWQKGIHILIQAMNRLRSAATLTIYGDMDQFPAYAAQLRAIAQHPGIRFAGPLDHLAVGQAMRRADYLVVPSLWYENSPVVIQEAYAVGLPVIASDLGALPEKVRDQVTGRLFEAGNAIALAALIDELAENPALRERYSANIRPGPPIDEHAAAMLVIYRRLIAQDRQAPD